MQFSIDFQRFLYFGSLWRTYIDAFVPGAVSGVELALGLPAGLLYAPGQGVNGTATQDNTTQSIFAQFDIKLTERLDAILGQELHPTFLLV